MAIKKGVKHIIFLSVQGAENASFIPHAKIEKLIRGSMVAYTFLRPSYFMQNLSTALRKDIKEHNRIFLPAGSTKFLWIDVSDIGKAVAAILNNTESHINKIYTLTGNELYNFKQVAEMLSRALDRKIKFISPNLLKFFYVKRKEGVKMAYILVMIMLHYLPRFQKPPEAHHDLKALTGEDPVSLHQFINLNTAH